MASFERGDTAALDGILAAARPRDGLTLWHLLTRVPAQDRAAVFDRFAELVKLPPEVSRERVLRKDPEMIDLCWNALELREYRLVARLGTELGSRVVRGRGPGE